MNSPKNIAASVHQRLLNRAKSDQRPFNELLQYYAMERFLYRLCRSAYADLFVLKGALMLRIWGSSELRPTKDIDFLGRTTNEEANVVAQIRDIMAVVVEADGLNFDPQSIQSERITEDADYEGIRIRFLGFLGSARVHMQVDIGFGDVIHPAPEELEYPSILNFPAPRLLCYSRETSIAEKFEAMVNLGVLNSRMKDFYDIWFLSRQSNYSGAQMAEAIRLTFDRRGRAVPVKIEAFSKPFIDAKQIQWAAFRKRLRQDHIPESFETIVAQVDRFLTPVAAAVLSRKSSPATWTAPGPWV